MNEAKLKEDSYFGKQAETLVSNPAYQAAITRVKAKIFDQWSNTGVFQSKERKDLWRMARVVDDFENEIRKMVEDGHLADQDIDNQKRLKSVKY